MSEPINRALKLQNVTILLATATVSAVFIGMVWQFLIALFLAAVFSGLSYPLYQRLLTRFGGRKNSAATATLVIVVLIVMLPALGMINLIGLQAVQLTEELVPWVQEQVGAEDRAALKPPDWLPFRAQVEAVRPQIVQKLGELATKIGTLFVEGLSSATKGTAGFLLDLFVMLYAMFFFLKEGEALREKLIALSPISRSAQLRLVEKGMSVTRATIKGTVIIGLIQGLLGGIAFAVVGIQGAAFWGAVMAVASVIPSVGTALVWVPAVGYLAFAGEGWLAVGLGLWSMLIVGSVDNLLRPILVGGDTEMPDLLILISTLGGIAMFGIAGIIIGPVIAALFLTMWDLYYLTFQKLLDKGLVEGEAHVETKERAG